MLSTVEITPSVSCFFLATSWQRRLSKTPSSLAIVSPKNAGFKWLLRAVIRMFLCALAKVATLLMSALVILSQLAAGALVFGFDADYTSQALRKACTDAGDR